MPHSPSQDELIAVGKILRAVGLNGSCRVESFGSTLNEALTPLRVSAGKSPDHTQLLVITQILHQPKGIICQFEGINDRDSAEKLQSLLIFLSSDELPSLENETFYHFELEGMKVYSDSDNVEVGFVEEVYDYPSADTLEIKRTDGSYVLIPLIDKAIKRIDKEKQTIIVRQDFLEELL